MERGVRLCHRCQLKVRVEAGLGRSLAPVRRDSILSERRGARDSQEEDDKGSRMPEVSEGCRWHHTRVGYHPVMTHTISDKKNLISRIRRIRGQLNGIERALLEEKDCFSILQTSTACRGALNSLIAEILEGHIRSHLLEGARSKAERDQAAHELIDVVNAFLK